MKIDIMTGPANLREIQTLARDVEDAGISGMLFTEGGRTAFLSAATAALETELELSTGVALAFPRSPMITAQLAWELAEATSGRFRLGLGTQVKAHITRRYGMEFDSPGPRLEDYVKAMRAIFAAFRGDEKLNYEGRFWELTLLDAFWSPGKIEHDDPKIDIAAVGEWMLEAAGRVADGVHIHPLNTPTYLRETAMPAIAKGAATNGRDVGGIQLVVPTFTAVGETEEERASWRETTRGQLAFYGSTPNYAFIFDQLGFEGTTTRIREKQKARDQAGMTALITDEMLEHFLVECTWDELSDRLVDRYDGLADRVVLYYARRAHQKDPSTLARFGEAARDVVARTE